ncbi:MAG TPA: hypothetical protein PK916_11540 [Bacteroidota bacterium]|nr:hypothetical protein [Bacteroidota bacterium]
MKKVIPTMNRSFLSACVLTLFVLLGYDSVAQVTMNALIRKPTPTSLTEWRRDPTIVRLNIINASRDRHENTMVSITIRDTRSDAIVARTKDYSPSMPRFTLMPGQTLTLSGPDIIRQDALEVDQSLRTIAATTDALPEGDYELCVRLLAADGVTELAAVSPLCIPFEIIIPDPPQLIAPWDGQAIAVKSYPVFQWTPVAPLPTGMRVMYRLRVVPMFGGQTARQAMESNTEYIIDKRVSSTTYMYSPTEKPFSAYPSATGWAWQVQALDVSTVPNGIPAARNEGKSEIWTFALGGKGSGAPVAQNSAVQQQQNAGPEQCSAPCITQAPTENSILPGTLAVGDSVTVGLFTMELTELTNPSASSLSGKGLMHVPFLRSRIHVQFNGVRVNINKQVLDPGVQAELQAPMSIPQANNMAQRIGINPQTMQQIQTWVGQAGRLVSGLSGATPVYLPIGIDNTIPTTGHQLVVSIIGAVFNPDGAQFNAVCQLPLPFLGPGGTLGFGVNGICMHPGGVGAGNNPVRMYLIDDFGYDPMNGSWSLQLLRENNGQGTWAEMDCTGFKKLHVHGEVGFARSALVPVPDNGQTVKLNLIADIQKNDVMNWLFQLSPSGPFAPAALKDFAINVPAMYLDFADDKNPPQMVFPADYKGPSKDSLDWHGFYMPSATVTLPAQFKTGQNPVSISVSSMLVDNTGFTAGIAANDIIAYPGMNVSSWGASLDHIDVQITNSSFKHGSLNGKLQIPISTQPLDYSMLLAQTDSGMSYLCNVIPGADIDVPMWMLTLTIEPTSIFQMTANSTGFEAYIELNGMLGFQKTVGTIPLINLTGLKFSKLKLTTSEPYFELGQMALASPQHGVGGFPVSLTGIKPVVQDIISNKPKFGLQFGMALNLMGEGSEASAISGETHFTVLGSYDKTTKNAAFEDAYLDDITLNAQLGAAVNINGTIVFYRNHAQYGNGFFGTVQAQFLEMVEISATAMFGSKKKQSSQETYRYWFADAKAILPTGIPLGGALVIRGMGIGAWYNMSAQLPASPLTISEGEESNTASTQIGVTNSGIVYTPSDQGEWGLKAAVVIAAPSDQLFNADVELGASFVNGGLASIFLSGKGYMLTSIYDRSDPSIYGSVLFYYDNVNKEFTGNLDIKFNVNNVVTGGGNVVLFASPDEWYLWMGRPTQRIELKLLGVYAANSYFEIGTTIDNIAEIPATILNHMSHSLRQKFSTSNRQSAVDMAANFGGAAFGVWSGFPKKKFSFGPFYASLEAGYGFDASVMNYGDLKCGNTGEVVGLDGWYCQAQAYAYLSGAVGISVDLAIISGDFEILGVDAGAALKAQLPNPTWLGGVIYGSYSILGGLISGSVTFEFEIGEQCKLPQSNPLDNIKLVSDFRPDGKEIADVYTVPQVAFTFPVHKEFELPITTPSGDPSTRVFKIKIDDFRIERKDNKENVAGQWAIQEGGSSAVFLPMAQLRSNSNYKTRIAASAWEKKSGQWAKSLYSPSAKNGVPGTHITERDSVSFTTGTAPNYLPVENVQYSWPLDRQRFFLQNQIQPKIGLIKTRMAPDELFSYNRPGFKSSYLAKFQPLNNRDSMKVQESPITYSGGEIRFPIPQLDNNTTYKLTIVRRDEKLQSNTTNNIVMGGSGLDKLKTTTQKTTLVDSRSDKVQGGTTLGNKQGGVQVSDVSTSTYNTGDSTWTDKSFTVGQQLATSTVAVSSNALLANLVSGGDKKLYELHFRTSAYNRMIDKLNAATVKPSTSESKGDQILVRANFTMPEPLEDYEVLGHVYKGVVMKDGLYYEQNVNVGPLLVVQSDEQTKPWHTSFALPNMYTPFSKIKTVMASTKSPYFKKAFKYWNTTYFHYWRDQMKTLTHVDRQKSRILDPLGDSEINPPAPAGQVLPSGGKYGSPGSSMNLPQQQLPIGQSGSMYLSSMSVNYTQGVAAALDYQNLQNRLAKFFTTVIYTNNQNPDENGEIEYSKGGPKIEKSTIKEVGDPKRDYSGAVYSMLENLWKSPFKKLQHGTYPLRFGFKFGTSTTTIKNTSFTW